MPLLSEVKHATFYINKRTITSQIYVVLWKVRKFSHENIWRNTNKFQIRFSDVYKQKLQIFMNLPPLIYLPGHNHQKGVGER